MSLTTLLLPFVFHLAWLAKEIQLMHRAPVVSVLVLDGRNVPLPEPLEVAHDLSKSPDMQGSHQLLVVSEEQFKVSLIQEVCMDLSLKSARVLHSVQ